MLCEACMDSHAHLFFECAFPLAVWHRVKREVNLVGFPDEWSEIIARLSSDDGPRRNTVSQTKYIKHFLF